MRQETGEGSEQGSDMISLNRVAARTEEGDWLGYACRNPARETVAQTGMVAVGGWSSIFQEMQTELGLGGKERGRGPRCFGSVDRVSLPTEGSHV